MIDVFICTYNPRYEYLKRTIEGILSQDLNSEFWNLVIIDNNSTNPVEDLDFIKKNNVKVIREVRQGLTAARECALNNTSSDILVFVDDDLVINQNYLSKVKELFELNDLGVVSGSILPEYETKPLAWFDNFESMIAIRRIVKGQNIFLPNKGITYNSRFPIGAGMAIRRSLLYSYYKEHLNSDNYIEGRKGNELSSCEDLDLDFYAIHKKFQIGISSYLEATHLIPSNRVSLEYINRLAYYSLKSSFQLNMKWKPIFQQDIFDFCSIPRTKVMLRVIYHWFFKKNNVHNVKYNHFKNILEFSGK